MSTITYPVQKLYRHNILESHPLSKYLKHTDIAY